MNQLRVAFAVWQVMSLRRRVTVVLSVLAVTIFAATTSAQQKPNFSGRWTLVQSTQPQEGGHHSGSSGGGIFGGSQGGFGGHHGGSGGGHGGEGHQPGSGPGGSSPAQNLVIRQDAHTLTIEQGTQTIVYKLDGSESVNSTASGQSRSMASWDAEKLVIKSTQPVSMGGRYITLETREVRWLDADGNMVIGTTSDMGQRSMTTGAVYQRAN